MKDNDTFMIRKYDKIIITFTLVSIASVIFYLSRRSGGIW